MNSEGIFTVTVERKRVRLKCLLTIPLLKDADGFGIQNLECFNHYFLAVVCSISCNVVNALSHNL